MEFNIDPKNLNLQDAAGMQLVEVIRNLAEESGTVDYEDLENLPKINSVELKGNKTTSDLNISYNDLDNLPKINGVELTGNKSTSDLDIEIDPTDIASAVDTWCDTNVAQETGYVLDSSLSMSNAAAPADKVGEIKDALYPLVPEKNLIDFDACIMGKELSNNIGEVQSSSTWYVTDWIEVEPNTQYALSGTSSTFKAEVNAAKDTYTGIMNVANSTFVTGPNTKYVRFNSKQDGYSTPQLEKGATPTEYEPYTLIPQKTAQLVESVSNLQLVTEETANALNTGYTDALTIESAFSNTAQPYVRIRPYALADGDYLAVRINDVGNVSSWNCYGFRSDETYKQLFAKGAVTDEFVVVSIDDSFAYIQINVNLSESGSGTITAEVNKPCQALQRLSDRIDGAEQSVLAGKSIGFLGDSFTENANFYGKLIADKTGCVSVNYGVSGRRYYDHQNWESGGVEYDVPAAWESVKDMQSGLDIVCSFCGINDANNTTIYTTKLGTINDVALTQVEIDNGAEAATFYQGCKTTMELLMAKYPTAKILMILPPHVLDASYDPTFVAYPGIETIIEAEKAVAKFYGIQTVDLYSICTELNNFSGNVTRYRQASNNIHPNANGQKAMAHYIENALVELVQNDYLAE